MDERTWQTSLVTIFLLMAGILTCNYQGWFSIKGIIGWVFILIGMMNLLGLMMDLYFKKKYGSETLKFAKETYPVLFKKEEKQESQAPSAVLWRKIKGWFKQ